MFFIDAEEFSDATEKYDILFLDIRFNHQDWNLVRLRLSGRSVNCKQIYRGRYDSYEPKRPLS